MDISTLTTLQQELQKKLQIPAQNEGYFPKTGDFLASFDVQYVGEVGFVAIDVIRWEIENLGVFLDKQQTEVPYQAGFFAFREGIILEKSLQNLKKEVGISPDFLLIDGHGTAHPKKMGVASWLGIQTKTPSIGLAKETLLPFEGILGENVGDTLAILLEKETVGYAFRSQENTKPIFVSTGHLISQKNALEIVLRLRGKYRVAEPIRRADFAARSFAKNKLEAGFIPSSHLGL